MNRIEIYHNYNGKMFCDTFSHLEPLNPEIQLGEEYELWYRSLRLGTVEVRALRNVLFSRITPVLSMLYCGQPLHFLSTMLNRQYNQGATHAPDAIFIHAVLGWTYRSIEIQSDLLKEWWDSKVLITR